MKLISAGSRLQRTDYMKNPLKTVRVFVSSTFRDMHAEGDHLVTVVFPELRERIEQRVARWTSFGLLRGSSSGQRDGRTFVRPVISSP
jgi:hypothetical protein